MPRYHSLDTEVQLRTWDPSSCQSIFLGSSGLATQTILTDSHLTSSSRSEVPIDASAFNGGISSADHDRPHKVKRLTEKYFEGREGLDFLGCDAPFFLVHAGSDSSNDKRPAELWSGTNISLHQDSKVFHESSKELTWTPFSSRSQITGNALPGMPYMGSTVNEGHQDQSGLSEVYSSSPLSSLSSTEFLSPHASDLRYEEPRVEIGGRAFASVVTPKTPRRNADNFGKSFRAPKLEIVTRPVQVVVKLSEKSFISPLLGTESDRCDICINLFYNGEFNTSQVIKYSDWAAFENKNCFDFSGRRIGTGHELPWVITAGSKDADNTVSQIGKGDMALTPVERWNKLAEMLLLEANEWGRDERGYRCPTGEYLELLSKKAIPSELDDPLVSLESGFGVIDVVITLGRVFHHDAAKEISSPHRNLHASQPVAAQVERKIATPSLAGARALSRDSSGPLLFNGLSSFAIEVEHRDTPGTSSTSKMSPGIAASSRHGDQINLGAVGGVTPMAGVIYHSTGTQAVSACIPAAVAMAPTPRPPHPNRPHNVPQKTYRGSEPVQPPSPPSKRRKTTNLFEELPFDLNTATYMSTRARRSASMPFGQTSPHLQPESSLKRKRSVNQANSTLSNAETTETSMARTPLTPKKDKVSNPKTPESGGPLKKKPRSSNFNAKLSNRPQNLRRKNSAGEWIIPPCRRNSAGEWETPTKGGQSKTAGDLGGQADGATEESGKIFQPVFTDSADNASRKMAIGPDTANQISPNGDKITLMENLYQRNSAEKTNRLAPTVAAVENKKENIRPSKLAGQSNEVANPVTPTKTMSSPSEVKFREVKSPHTPVEGCPNRELLDTSPPPAGALAFESYFRRMQNDATIPVIKYTPRKRTLRMRFFEGNVSSDGEIVGGGCGTRRWLVRRCISPEYIPAPGSGKKPASYHIYDKPKLKLSGFATGPKGEKVTDVLTDSTTGRSCRKSGAGDTAGLAATNKSVIATLRGRKVGNSQQLQSPAITQPRPRFVVPNHNSRVIKLVNRRPVATGTDGIKQEAQDASGQAAGSKLANEKFGGDSTNDSDGIDASESPILATQDGSRHNSRPDTGLKAFTTPQSVNNKSTVSPDGSAMILAQEKDITQGNDSEAQLVQEDEASTEMPAARLIPKRPFRPRTVGPTELKALLESHDRHNVANTSLGASLGMMHSQPMTRGSRNTILSKPRRVIATGGVVTDKVVSSDKPTVQLPVTSNRVPRNRSSSGQIVEKTTNATITPKHAKNADGAIFKVTDAQISSNFHPGASTFEAKKPLSKNTKTGTPNPIAVATMAYDLSLLGVGEFPPNDIPIAQTAKKAVSRPQKVLEIPKGTMMDLGGKPVKRADKLETLVGHLNGASIDKPTPRPQKSKEEVLETDVCNAMNFEEAAGKVDVALKQVSRAKKEINKAVGDLESLTVRASAQRMVQKAVVVTTDRAKISNAKRTEASATNMQGSKEENTPASPALALGTNPWKPGCLCDDSILSYAKDEDWDGLERNPVTGQICRRVGTQDEGCFKAFGVLMGVRYVVVGSAGAKEW